MKPFPFSARCGSVALCRLAGALGLVAIAGCSLPQAQPDLTRYYVLNSAARATAPAEAPAEGAPRVFLRALSVPEYLRGRILAVRLGPTEVRYVDEARWAEPLEPGLARVLREDLANRPDLRLVQRGTDVHEFDVLVQVRRCEGVLPERTGQLAAHIEITAAGLDPKLVVQEDFSIGVPAWDGKDYAQLTARLSEAATALAERVAALVPQRKP